jgi:oxalate---CoA ligase
LWTVRIIHVTAASPTVWSLLAGSAHEHPHRAAILAPDREPLTYLDLAAHVVRTAGHLRHLGFEKHSRIAVVLPNGPEMATAFAALASSAVCAPLNPTFARADIDFYLKDLRADALLVDERASGGLVDAAVSCGVPLLRVRPGAKAGDFTFVDATAPTEPVAPGWPDPGDTALLLHTSGTTSRPKLVPLTSANLVASARSISSTLALLPDDRCLNVMPLFHIHGLMAAVLASLSAGACVVCSDGLYSTGFYTWLRQFRPTWYTAVPTMHQAILSRARDHADVIADVPLRLVRSSSAALPLPVLALLEETFHAPVLEAYGMTEAAHQMASNPLPPRPRKPGSVGLPAGPDIAVMDPNGQFLPSGEAGEIVIRGANVTAGYEDNAHANAEAFRDGWFRTGDQGRIDEDGYLRLTGRLKEQINRGGEKISPREVDEVLLSHPAVRQAVCFAVAHAQLGEEIGAAVEVHAQASVTAAELRAWAGERLPAFKVPRVIRFLDEIPKGPTGKLQRVGLASRLGIEPLDDLGADVEFVPPRSVMETRIAEIWSGIFPGRPIGVTTRFEALGGDSLLAVRMLAEVSERIGRDVPYLVFAEDGTIEALAAALEVVPGQASSPLMALRASGSRPPLYCIPGHDGVLHGLDRLARALPPSQPVWAFDLRRIERADSVEHLANRCVDLLLAHDPHGPYRLIGLCFGGVVAADVARQLIARNRQVAFLGLIDALNPSWHRSISLARVARARVAQAMLKSRYHATMLHSMAASARVGYLAQRGSAFVGRSGELLAARFGGRATRVHHLRLAARHLPQPVAAHAFVVRVLGRRPEVPDLGWKGVFAEGVTTVDVPFALHGALAPDSADRVAGLVSHHLT